MQLGRQQKMAQALSSWLHPGPDPDVEAIWRRRAGRSSGLLADLTQSLGVAGIEGRIFKLKTSKPTLNTKLCREHKGHLGVLPTPDDDHTSISSTSLSCGTGF